MSPQTVIRLAIIALAGIGPSAGPALAASKIPSQKAKISMIQARQIALKAYPGQIVKEEERVFGSIDLRNI
jgi:hypothetical protein